METTTFLNDFSTLVTVISSIVAIAAVSVCAILTAVITQRGARKAKHSELIFQEKVSAYYEFLKAADEFTSRHNISEITRFSETSARVMLFASKQTQKQMKSYSDKIMETLIAKDHNATNLMELAQEVGLEKGKLIQAMQKDLQRG